MDNRSRVLLHPGRQIAGLNQLFNFSKISAVFVRVSMMVMLMLMFVFMCMSRMGVLALMRAMMMVFVCMSCMFMLMLVFVLMLLLQMHIKLHSLDDRPLFPSG